jgi:Fe2+ transport system protein FeoA
LPKEVRLATLKPGSRAAVSRVSEVAEREAPMLLNYLHERGLTPGREVAVDEVDAVGRTIRIRSGNRSVTLSSDTAAKLWVVPA